MKHMAAILLLALTFTGCSDWIDHNVLGQSPGEPKTYYAPPKSWPEAKR